MPEDKPLSLWTNLLTCSVGCTGNQYTSLDDLTAPIDPKEVTKNRSKIQRAKEVQIKPEEKNLNNTKSPASQDMSNIANIMRNDQSAWKRFRQTLGFKSNKNCGQVTYIHGAQLEKMNLTDLKKNLKGKKGPIIIIPKIVLTGPEGDAGRPKVDGGDTVTNVS